MSEDLATPVGVERRLIKLISENTRATGELGKSRLAEVRAKHRYEEARRRAMFADDCPKVQRGGYTTAERDAWVDERCAKESLEHDLAEVSRKSDEDYMRMIDREATMTMAVGKSVTNAYRVSGVTG